MVQVLLGHNKVKFLDIPARHFMKMMTLLRWIKANPQVWARIKTFVYDRELNKPASQRSDYRNHSAVPQKQEKKRFRLF